jgi:tetratricopeptide (TPR) repeat protein
MEQNTLDDIKLLENEGWSLLNQKMYDGAIEIFDEIFLKEPVNIAAFQGKIASLRKKEQFDKANELLTKGLHYYPDHPGILSERAWLNLAQKQYDDAINAFYEVLKVNRDDEGIFLWQTSLLRSQRRFDEAQKLIAEASKLFPRNIQIQNENGWVLFYQMRYNDAIEIFENILKNHPNNESSFQGQIATLRVTGQYAEAIKTAKHALNYFNNSPGIHSELGWIYFEQGNYEEAELYFKKVLSFLPDDPLSHINLAWTLTRQGDENNLNEAATYCRKALTIDSNLAEAYGCLGNIAFLQGHIRTAERLFLRSIQIDSKKGNYADLGALYIQMGQYASAQEKLEKAIENNPDDVYAHTEMGNLFLQIDNTKEAIREFRLATIINRHHPHAFNALAIALMESKNFIEAEKILRNAIRSFDTSKRWELHLTLCRLLTKLGDETDDLHFYEEALKEVNSAICLKPKHAAPYFHSGIVRFKLEDYKSSLSSFRRCLKEEAHYLEAELNIRRVQSLIRKEKNQLRASRFVSIFLVIIFLVQLTVLWILRFTTNKIPDTMMTVFVPIILGLIVVAVLLPWLNRLKLTGIEAELTQPSPKQSLTSGPKGEIGFGNVFPRSL